MLDFTQLNLRMRPEIFRFPSQKIKNVMEMVDKKMRGFIVVCQLIDTAPELVQRRGQSLTVFFVRNPKRALVNLAAVQPVAGQRQIAVQLTDDHNLLR